MPARLSTQELIEKYHIDVQDLFNTYITNGKNFTAAQFGLSNWRLVERILIESGYDLSLRDSKAINVQKTSDALMRKYGVKHALQISESKEKLINTNRERFNSDYYMGTPSFKQKSIETNLKKYGYEWSTQSPEVKAKHDAANYEKYGVKDAKQRFCSDELKTYLNDREKSVNFLCENSFTFFDLCRYFSQDRESQLWSWLYRFNLFDYLKHSPKSFGEQELAEFLEPFGFTQLTTRKLLGNGQEIDIYNPDLKIGVEYNGTYYHCDKCIADKNYHLNKSRLAEDKGIRLIHVYEYEWQDPNIRPKLESLLRIASNKVNSKIYARNCGIREISNKEAKVFNDMHHLQNHRNAQVTYGLFYNDELVQLMSFSKTKYNRNLKTDNSWEIIRGCPGSNNIVVGGVSKLFKHFIKMHNPSSIFSYCDFNKFDGKGYEAIGMKFIGYTGPDKKWIIERKVVNRKPHKYHELKNKAEAAIWGAGSKKYVWINDKIN